MQTVCIDCKWDAPISLGEDVINYLKNNSVKSVALFASVQFLALDIVKKQLSDLGIKINITSARRANAPVQILGCDAYHDSFEKDIITISDAVLYIGDGYFHPKALLLSQIHNKRQIKPAIIWNPVLQKMELIGVEVIQRQIDVMIANIKKFVACKTVGILVTAKPGQQYLTTALRLKEKLHLTGKKAYIFIDDDIQINLFENYPFIDAWVNTACPRIGMDDHVNVSKPLINLRDAFDPISSLEKLSPK